MTQDKSYAISKQVVWEAYKKVKANRGAAGVDQQTLDEFEKDLKGKALKKLPVEPKAEGWKRL